jgi:hypothetical protein
LHLASRSFENGAKLDAGEVGIEDHPADSWHYCLYVVLTQDSLEVVQPVDLKIITRKFESSWLCEGIQIVAIVTREE